MKKLFLTVLVIVSACSATNEVPDDLIPQEEMIQLMTEIHILEAKIKNLNIQTIDSATQVYQHYEQLLFSDFGITSEQYEQSFNYYVDNMGEFKKIYDAVVDTLMQREKLQND